MRFSRRAKERGRTNRRREEGASAEGGTVASEERSALIGTAVEEGEAMPEEEYETTEAADPTQQLLTYLGRFQRQLHKAQQGAAQGEWSDDAMHQLVLAVELAIANEWPEVVEALTDTARVLQTYEDNSTAGDALPFLNDAYEILCLMVGDLIVDSVRASVRDKWRARYSQAVETLREQGFELVEDADTNESALNTGSESPEPDPANSRVIPFELPEERKPAASQKSSELPTLDELPPLESLIGSPSSLGVTSPAHPETPASETEPAQPAQPEPAAADESDGGLELFGSFGNASYLDAEDTAEEPQAGIEQPEMRPLGPSRLVVDILDQMCDQLSRLENASAEHRSHYIERVSNGVSVLQREALENDHEHAVKLCAALKELCQRALNTTGPMDTRFTDIGYAFCGVYTEAFTEEESDTVANWQAECEALLESWRQAAPVDTTEPDTGAEPAQVEPEDDTPEEPAPFEADFGTIDEPETEEAAGAAPESAQENTGVSPSELQDLMIPSLDELQDEPPAAAAETEASEPTDSSLTLDAYAEVAPVETPDAEPAEPVEAADERVEVPQAAPAEAEEAPAPAEPEPAPEEAPAATDEPETAELRPDEARSRELLFEAQRAAVSGDGTGAKNLALQAAALFARLESEKAQERLEASEERLKESREATEQARDAVKQGEQMVMEAATAVSEGEGALGQAKEQTASVAQQLHDIEGTVADLEEQIRALQQKREEELQRAEETRNQLGEVESQEAAATEHLEELRKNEEEARVALEKRRQHVSDLQHTCGEIETDVEEARAMVDKQRRSLADIEETLYQLFGETIEDKPGENEENDGLLF